MRRTAIAGILAMEPEVLVLDEPTRGLDPKGAKEMMELFKALHQEHNKTIVLISHDMDVVSEYATRIIVLDEGKIVYDGNKEELFSHKDFLTFNIEKPQTYKLLEHICLEFEIPFKPIFNEKELIAYLKEVFV